MAYSDVPWHRDDRRSGRISLNPKFEVIRWHGGFLETLGYGGLLDALGCRNFVRVLGLVRSYYGSTHLAIAGRWVYI